MPNTLEFNSILHLWNKGKSLKCLGYMAPSCCDTAYIFPSFHDFFTWEKSKYIMWTVTPTRYSLLTAGCKYWNIKYIFPCRSWCRCLLSTYFWNHKHSFSFPSPVKTVILWAARLHWELQNTDRLLISYLKEKKKKQQKIKPTAKPLISVRRGVVPRKTQHLLQSTMTICIQSQ